MQFSPLLLAAAVAAAASADASVPNIMGTPKSIAPRAMQTGDAYVTETVTAYVSYCPEPTTFVQNNNTYIVTESNTWVTVNCPSYCTIRNIVGAQPTVVPAGVNPKYNNVTAQCTEHGACPKYNNGTVQCPGNSACPQPLQTLHPAPSEVASGSAMSTSGSVGASGSSGSGSSAPGSGSSTPPSSSSGGKSPETNNNSPVAFTGAAGKFFISSAALAAFAGAVVFAL